MSIVGKPIEDGKVNDVVQFFESLELHSVVPAVRDNAISGADLLELDDNDLADSLSLTPLQLSKIRKGLAQLRSASGPDAPTATYKVSLESEYRSERAMSPTEYMSALSGTTSTVQTELKTASQDTDARPDAKPLVPGTNEEDFVIVPSVHPSNTPLPTVDFQTTLSPGSRVAASSTHTHTPPSAPPLHYFEPPTSVPATTAPPVTQSNNPPEAIPLGQPVNAEPSNPKAAPPKPHTETPVSSGTLPYHIPTATTVPESTLLPEPHTEIPVSSGTLPYHIPTATSVPERNLSPEPHMETPVSSSGQAYPHVGPATMQHSATTTGVPQTQLQQPMTVPPVADNAMRYPTVQPAEAATGAGADQPVYGFAPPPGFVPPHPLQQGFAPPLSNAEHVSPPEAYGTAPPVRPAAGGIQAATQKLVQDSMRLGHEAKVHATYAANKFRGQHVSAPGGRSIADNTVTVVNDSLHLASTAVKESFDAVKNLFSR